MSLNNNKTTALVGAGMVARTHIAACMDSQKVRLKGIASRGRERAKALVEETADDHGGSIKLYEDVSDIAADTEVDFVIIATPPNARADVIAPLAEAGKHILLEKPIGRTAQESREIVSLCEKAGVTLGVVFQHRMRAASQKAADLIASGEVGKLGLAEFSVPWWREQSYYDEPGRGTYARDGGGVLISQAIHTIDLGLSLTGPVATVRAMASTTIFHEMESEDYVVAGLEFAGGAVGSLVASTASFPGAPESIKLHFEHASLHLEAGQLRVDWRDGRQEIFGEEVGTGGGADPMAFTHAWHQAVLEDFIDALNDGRQPIANGKAALPAHELIEAITRSAESGMAEEVGSWRDL